MGRCAGACCGKITREEYLKIVDGVRKLLSGRSAELVREIREKMKAASETQEFERAAKLRDQISAIEEVSVEQRVMEFTEEDRDYIALAPCGESQVVVVLQVREGKLLGKEVFEVAEYAPDEEALSHFVARYYAERKTIPDAVYVGRELDGENLSLFLRELTGRQIAVKMPQRGKHTQLISMAESNAREEAAKAARGAEMTMALEGLKAGPGPDDPSPQNRGIRYRAPGGHRYRRVHGTVHGRQAGPETLPRIHDQEPERKGGRLRIDTRGGCPPLYAGSERGAGPSRPDPH